ncbi:endonuclease/exonuclease/phosphatase family protein [Rhodococcus daqingensis]|uniref:Endonuclease/exonuclease/phosphatase family protein n=1 Tax=Rhodococcus daqingensis TaxID=2479363 RepID=A0ABW2RVE8_9NOCA
MTFSETYRRSAGVFAAACGLLGAAALLASLVTVEIRFVVLLAGWTPVAIGTALLGAVVAAIARQWAAQCLCLVVCALGAWLLGPLFVAGTGATSPHADGPTLRVLQANAKLGQADPNLLTDLVRDRDVDVLTVQELTDEAIDGLGAAGLDDLLPHRFAISYGPNGLGGGIYSRFPLSNTRVLDGYLSANLAADLDIGLREPVALFAVHPAPAYLFPATMWAGELRGLGAEFANAAERDNVIASGDFNASYSQRQYRALLTAGYADAADQVGAGLVPTMPAHRWYPAVVGIDRVITKGAAATGLERVAIAGSDHYGVIADIRLVDAAAR